MNISIIIFCYNEKDSINKVIQSSFEVAALLSDTYEIIVVDDGSTDGTSEIIRGYPELKSVVHATNLGIGPALRSGYNAATGEFVCAIPGDGQFDVYELLQVKPFSIRTVWSFYRVETHYSIYRSFLTFCNKVFNKFFLNIAVRDINWIKVYRGEQLDFVDIQLSSSIVESEICAKLMKAGCTLTEHPSIYHERRGGTPTGGNWKTLSKAINEMFALYNTVRHFKKKLPNEC